MTANAQRSLVMTFLVCALVLFYSPAQAAFEPNIKPTLSINRTTGEIDIDGRLDDTGWHDAGKAQGFSEIFPGNNIEPLQSTEVWVTYNEDHLYVAFICKDDPANIRATLCQRDQFFNDDYVGILIDTYGEAQWAYEFMVNPYGIQKDLMFTNVHGEDRGFDMIWHSAAEIQQATPPRQQPPIQLGSNGSQRPVSFVPVGCSRRY